VGIKVLDGKGALLARIFKGGRLWRACSTSREFALNICLDPELFLFSVLERSRLSFSKSALLGVPVVNGCEGYLECVKIGSVVTDADSQLVYLQVVNEVVNGLKPYTRALGLAIEVLIELTRILSGVKGCSESKQLILETLDRMRRVEVSGGLVSELKRAVERVCGFT